MINTGTTMTTLEWHPAKPHDAQAIGERLRRDEARRLNDFTGHPATHAFVGVYNGALGSAVITADGTPVAMLCANPCSALGMRVAHLGLTHQAEGINLPEQPTLANVSQHVHGDSPGIVGSAYLSDKVQARWYRALGFQPVPEAWAPGCPIALFYRAQPGALGLIQAYAQSLCQVEPEQTVIH